MIHRIILDVDDVLNSLSLHIIGHFGGGVLPFDYGAFPISVGYDIISACEILGGSVPHKPNPDWDDTYETDESIPDVAAFWDRVTRDNLWRAAPKSPQCDNLIDRAASIVGREEVYLATTPTKDPQSHGDKLHWIWDNLPSWIHRQYFITPRKWLLGKPGVVLFDDHLNNCESFVKEGGEALLVPRPWNPDYSKDTDGAINVKLDEIQQGRKHVSTFT